MDANLKDQVDWHQPNIKIMGREMPIPRLQAYYGIKGAFYRYSHLNLKSMPFNETLLQIRTATEACLNTQLNAALLNFIEQDRIVWGFMQMMSLQLMLYIPLLLLVWVKKER